MKFVFLLLLFNSHYQLEAFFFRSKEACLAAYSKKTNKDYRTAVGPNSEICTKIEVTK